MIYQQPVRYEYHLIAPPTLVIVGAEDHVVPLGQYAQPAEAKRLGDFVELSAAAASDIPNAKRVVVPDCGHIPHLEHPDQFLSESCHSSRAEQATNHATKGPNRCRHSVRRPHPAQLLPRSVRLPTITGRTAISVVSKTAENRVRATGCPHSGGYVVEGEHFLVEHVPLQESSAGTVILEARRHLLDFGEMTPTESAELGSILRRLVPAIKAATGVQRVYFLAVMERAPHFHLWLVPKKNEGELRGVGYLAQQPPLTASYSAAEEMSRNIRADFDQS